MTKWIALGILGLIVWRGYALYEHMHRARREAEDTLRPDYAELDPHRVRLLRDSGRAWRRS